MIASAKRKRKPRKKNRGAAKNIPEFKPEWINAFMLMLLQKIACSECGKRDDLSECGKCTIRGSQTLTVTQLKAFDEVTEGKQPDFSWDGEIQAFTITTPEHVMPVIIEPPKPKLII